VPARSPPREQPENRAKTDDRLAQKLRTAAVIAVTDGSLVVAVDYVDAVASVPVTVERVFEVDASLDDAWRRLADVQRWPEWAPHITAATVSPPGTLGPTSSGALHIKWMGRNTFRMSVWDPPHRWQWVGAFPGVRVLYDHRFAASGPGVTRLEWLVQLDGPLAPLVRPVFARVYGRNVDRAIPRLQEWFRR
jgi:hypothetical protein